MRKRFLILSLLLSAVVTFFLIIIFIFVHPDYLKPFVTAQFEKYSNSTINIDDHLSFTFFPFFGIKANYIQIRHPAGSQVPDITVGMKNTIVQLKLLPFLRRTIKMGLIQVDEIIVNQRSPFLTMQFNDVQFKISAVNELNHTFMTTLSFKPIDKHHARSEDVVIISSSASINTMDQSLSWKNIHAVMSDLIIDGELTVKNLLSYPDIAGHFMLQAKNLKNALDKINFFAIKMENIPDIHQVNGNVDVFVQGERYNVKSNMYIKNIQTPEINIDNIHAKLYFKNNILNMTFNNLSAYGGYLNGEMSMNVDADSTSIFAHVSGLNLQMYPILKLMQSSQMNIYADTKLSGTGNIELEVATTGTEITTLINHLNGTGHLSISNGLFMGKEWDDIIAKLSANHAITSEAISQHRFFRFKQLTASFKIYNGIFFNDDLLIDSSDISIKGKGQINLPNNFIDYVLQTEYQNAYNETTNNILPTIPIKGSLV